MKKNILQPDQEDFIDKLTDHLKDNSGITINVTPISYIEKEKEYVLFFEAKKRYYITKHHIVKGLLCGADSVAIDKISIKDSLFVHYLNKQVGTDMLFTVQDKCMKLVDSSNVNSIYNKLIEDRKKMFLSYFKNEGVASRVKFKADEEEIPFNGFSFYKINYKGEWPDDLKEAYYKMLDFNTKSPRDRFKRELIKKHPK